MVKPGSQNQPDEALLDLLIKQATEGLSAAELRELDVLDSAVASSYLREFERAAAAISLAGTTPEAPPAALRALIEQQAGRYYASLAEAPRQMSAVQTVVTAPSTTDNVVSLRPPVARVRGGSWGWLAAAACLLLAIFSWLRTPIVSVMPQVAVNVSEPTPVMPPTLADERNALLAKQDSLKVTLTPTKDPAAAGVTGDVVWDPLTQRGYLHFVGLAVNDPQVHQYQIWIFDGGRDPKYPVDAGVFDVPADSAEVVIPIRAALSIAAAKTFAVTLEGPGGVVVSALGHVVALGKAG